MSYQSTKKELQDRREVVANAKGYIKSILVALNKWKAGSNSEQEYIDEKMYKLNVLLRTGRL